MPTRDKHYLYCEAPICAGDPNPNYKKEVIWYPGEKVCQRVPYEKFQSKQEDLNRWVARGKFRNMEEGFNTFILETRLI